MPLQGDRIRDSRERKSLTQRELAERCGTTLFQISRYETGKSSINATALEALATNLDVSTDYLLGLVDEPNGHYDRRLRPDQNKLLEAYEAGNSTAIMELVLARARQS